jgi:hypothetical protein
LNAAIRHFAILSHAKPKQSLVYDRHRAAIENMRDLGYREVVATHRDNQIVLCFRPSPTAPHSGFCP